MQEAGAQGVKAHPKSFDSLKTRTKSRKMQARMFRHLCSHCLMNETDCRNASEFHFFFTKKKTHENICYWCVTPKKTSPAHKFFGQV